MPSINAARTQRVTASDIEAGRVRIPTASMSPAKSILPGNACSVLVVLRGQEFECRWDPRMGPDRERSGVLYVGSILRGIVWENEVLGVTASGDGKILLE